MKSILNQFLDEEATPYVRNLLAHEIAERGVASLQTFNFNRFDVTIDYINERVVLQDVLYSGASGESVVAIADFLQSLEPIPPHR